MRNLLLATILSLVAAPAFATPNTTQVPETLIVTNCSTTQLLIGQGVGVSPSCYNISSLAVPGNLLTGTLLASTIVSSSLTSAAGGSFGTAAYDATGTTGATIPLNNGGFTQSGAVNFTGVFDVNGEVMTWPTTNATLAYENTGSLITSGHCVQAGSNGSLTDSGVVGCGTGSGGGSVTTVSVTSANGLAGTVANPTTSPDITLSTTVTGLLKGNGTAIIAASPGTDYLVPTGSGASLTGITTGQISGLGTAATANTGTSGATIPLNNGNLTLSGTVNHTGAFEVNGYQMTFPALAATLLSTTGSGASLTGITSAQVSGLGSLATLSAAPAGSLTGTLATSAFPALTGDVSNTAGSLSINVTKLHGSTLTSGDWCNSNGSIINCGVTPVTNTNQLTNGAGFLTANQSITLGGDASGSGTTAITVTNGKVNGTSYPASPSTNTVPVVTGTNAVTYEAVPNAALANSGTTVNGTLCTLGLTCTVTATAGTITVGTTTIGSGTGGDILYDNGGTLGNLGTTGSGNVVLASSPTLVAPVLGTPASGVATNLTGTAASLTAGTATAANGLNSATTTVSVSAATAPTTGQVLTATSGTAATWQTSATSAPSAANYEFYVSTAGSDSNNCLTWQTACLTLTHAYGLATGTAGRINVGAGTYTLSATVYPEPNTELRCTPGAIITQANAANLTYLLDFNYASGASMRYCTVDGNRANNTDNGGVFLAYIGTANNVTFEFNTFQNANGNPVYVSTGLNPAILRNTFSNFFYAGIYVETGVAATPTVERIIGNRFSSIGAHAMIVDAADGGTITENVIAGNLSTGMTVSVSGTTLTWVSGPNFSTLNPGNFLIVGGSAYQEILISAIGSSISATAAATVTTAVSAPAIGGPGDLIDLASSNHTVISDNHLSLAAGGGVVVANFGAAVNAVTEYNSINDNLIDHIGGACIDIEGNGSPNVSLNSFVGNKLVDCIDGGVAIYQVAQNPYAAFVISGADVAYNFIDSNTTSDDQGSPTTPYWLATTGLSAPQTVGSHTEYGMVNAGSHANGIGANTAGYGP